MSNSAIAERVATRRAQVEKELAALRAELKAKTATRATVNVKGTTKQSPPPKPLPKNPYRPANLEEMVGQNQLIRQLKILIHGARLKGAPLPNILLGGAPGTGKTSIGGILADEIGAQLVTTTGTMLKKPEDLTSLLIQQVGPTVFFCDEAHRLAPRIQESLYTIMEDGTLDLIAGGESSQHKLPELVVVAATNQPGLLCEPFRSRLVSLTMTDYTVEELSTIVSRVWTKRNAQFAKDAPQEVARRSRGIPRTAVALAERVLDVSQVMEAPKIAVTDVDEALSLFNILPNGLDDTDMRVLRILCKEYAGKAVGLSALSQLVEMDPTSLAETVEPFLVKSGFVLRTARGRLATRAAYELVQNSA